MQAPLNRYSVKKGLINPLAILFYALQNEKEERLNQLENERKDFDMMLELALEKQRIKEKDLRKSLDVSLWSCEKWGALFPFMCVCFCVGSSETVERM